MIVSLISSCSTPGSRLGVSMAAAVWFALAPAAPASAQTLTRGTLKMVVPFAPGGPSDVAGRIVAAGLSEVLGRSVIVENPAGAGGTTGSLHVSRSPPDGSEFVLGNSGTHVWSQALYKTPPYNTLTDCSDSSSRRPGSSLPRRIFQPTRCRSSSPISKRRRERRNTATQAPARHP